MTVYSVISPTVHNPYREVVRWQFQNKEQAEEFIKNIKIVEVEVDERRAGYR